MTKIRGTHTFQFGAYIVFAQKNEANSPNVQGILTFDTGDPTVTTGNSFADLLLGNVASYQQWTAEKQYYDRYRIVEPYFQDDWRITKRLTLNLGLRVSLYGTYRERYRQAFNFDPTAFVAANKPGFNGDGSLNTGAGTGNPLNGFVQCGGTGGTFPLVPGSAFPTVSVGSSSNRSEEHTSELQSQSNLVCRLLLEKKKPRLAARRPRGLRCLDALQTLDPCRRRAPRPCHVRRSDIAPVHDRRRSFYPASQYTRVELLRADHNEALCCLVGVRRRVFDHAGTATSHRDRYK